MNKGPSMFLSPDINMTTTAPIRAYKVSIMFYESLKVKSKQVN